MPSSTVRSTRRSRRSSPGARTTTSRPRSCRTGSASTSSRSWPPRGSAGCGSSRTTGTEVRWPSRTATRSASGAARARCSRSNARAGPVAFVGEGHSDRYGALYADIVFAKDVLVDLCRDDGVPFVPYEDFDDVRATLEVVQTIAGSCRARPMPGVAHGMNLPEGLTARPLTLDDVDDTIAMVNTCELVDSGELMWERADLLADTSDRGVRSRRRLGRSLRRRPDRGLGVPPGPPPRMDRRCPGRARTRRGYSAAPMGGRPCTSPRQRPARSDDR